MERIAVWAGSFARNVNGGLDARVTTVFLMPPRGMAEVSSSMVKGLVGWERLCRMVIAKLHQCRFDQERHVTISDVSMNEGRPRMNRRDLLAGIVFTRAHLAGQITEQRTVDVDASRPLAEFARRFQAYVDKPINYEDVPYEHPGDLTQDGLPPEVRQRNPAYRVPRAGRLAYSFPADLRSRSALAGSHLATVALSHSQRGLPGDFEIVDTPRAIFIVPAGVRRANGRKEPIVSALVSQLNQGIEGARVRVATAILEHVQRATGFRTVLGTVPLQILAAPSPSVERGTTCRDGLVAALGPSLAYHLYFDPTLEWYVLNAHVWNVGPPSSV